MNSLDSIRNAVVNKSNKVERDPVKEAEFERVEGMYCAFYDRYKGYKKLKFFNAKPLKYGSKAYTTCLRACDEADKLAVEYSDWVDAQFFWFDKWSGDAPKIWNLYGGSGKMPATIRTVKYLAQKDDNQIKPVETTAFKITTPKAVVNQRNTELLNTLKDRFGLDSVEVFRRFAVPGNNFFDLNWLKQQEGYKAMLVKGY